MKKIFGAKSLYFYGFCFLIEIEFRTCTDSSNESLDGFCFQYMKHSHTEKSLEDSCLASNREMNVMKVPKKLFPPFFGSSCFQKSVLESGSFDRVQLQPFFKSFVFPFFTLRSPTQTFTTLSDDDPVGTTLDVPPSNTFCHTNFRSPSVEISTNLLSKASQASAASCQLFRSVSMR